MAANRSPRARCLGVGSKNQELVVAFDAHSGGRDRQVPQRMVLPAMKWTPFVGPRTVHIKVESRLPFLPSFFFFESPLSRFLLLFLLYRGYVGNAFALSKRSACGAGSSTKKCT